jgi:hypothetical protein
MRRDNTIRLAAGLLALGAPLSSSFGAEACAEGSTPIPDNATTLIVPIEITGSGPVESVEIDIDLTHPWLGDLTVELAKGAVVVRLMDRTSLGTYPFGCGGDDIDATFTDEGLATASDLCSPSVAPMVFGDVAPVDPLSGFIGVEASGVWELRISDAGAYDAGTLVGACLRVATPPPAGCVGDLDDDDDTDVFDFGIFASTFGSSVPVGTGGDLDGNGVVDVFDFSIFAGDFGCGPVAR